MTSENTLRGRRVIPPSFVVEDFIIMSSVFLFIEFLSLSKNHPHLLKYFNAETT